MKEIDYLALDGRSLRTFLTVLEELSVTGAATRLGVTQSAVSHILDKLRLVMGDPLFVRSGRGIVPTDRAIALRTPVRAVLDELKELTNERVFDPSIGQLDYVIAANDYQRDLIFPNLLKALYNDNINIVTHFIPAGLPAAELLRQDRCQLLVTPFPPEGPDIYQIRLFEDRLVCFYDKKKRMPPKTLKDFLECDFIDVRFEDNQSTTNVLSASIREKLKKPKITVPNFNAVYLFLKNSSMISVEPSLMVRLGYQDLQYAELPFHSRPVSMYLVWHQRNHTDPAHRWFREKIQSFIRGKITGLFS